MSLLCFNRFRLPSTNKKQEQQKVVNETKKYQRSELKKGQTSCTLELPLIEILRNSLLETMKMKRNRLGVGWLVVVMVMVLKVQ